MAEIVVLCAESWRHPVMAGFVVRRWEFAGDGYQAFDKPHPDPLDELQIQTRILSCDVVVVMLISFDCYLSK